MTLEDSELPVESMGDDRISIPLMMIRGNLDVLLDDVIAVEGISLKRYNEAGVVLVFHFADGQKEEAYAKGFQTKPIEY